MPALRKGDRQAEVTKWAETPAFCYHRGMVTKKGAKSPAQLQREIDEALGSPGSSGPRSSVRMVREREAARRDTRGLIAQPMLGGAEAFQRGYEFVHRDVLAGMTPEAAHDLSGSVRGESTAFRDGALAAQIHLGGHQDKSYAHKLAKAYGVDLRSMSTSHPTKKRTGRAHATKNLVRTSTSKRFKPRAHATKKTWTLDERTQMSRAFSRGNYANAYESTNLGDFDIAEMAPHERAAFVLGFFGSYELDEMGSDERDTFDKAYWSPAGQYVVNEARYTDARDDEYREERGE